MKLLSRAVRYSLDRLCVLTCIAESALIGNSSGFFDVQEFGGSYSFSIPGQGHKLEARTPHRGKPGGGTEAEEGGGVAHYH